MCMGFKLLRDYRIAGFTGRLSLLAVMLVFVSTSVAGTTPHGGWMVETGLGGIIGRAFLTLLGMEFLPNTPIVMIQYGVGLLSIPMFLWVVDITWFEWKYIFTEIRQWISNGVRVLWTWTKYAGALLWAWGSRFVAFARGQAWDDAVKSSPVVVAKPKINKRKSVKKTASAPRKPKTSTQLNMPLGADTYIPPSLDLLQDGFGSIKPPSQDELKKNASQLEEVLKHFKVAGRVRNVRPGPVVTLYEIELEPGTPSQKVISRADDIAMNTVCSLCAYFHYSRT